VWLNFLLLCMRKNYNRMQRNMASERKSRVLPLIQRLSSFSRPKTAFTSAYGLIQGQQGYNRGKCTETSYQCINNVTNLVLRTDSH
jgi:hypothetical protein